MFYVINNLIRSIHRERLRILIIKLKTGNLFDREFELGGWFTLKAYFKALLPVKVYFEKRIKNETREFKLERRSGSDWD